MKRIILTILTVFILQNLSGQTVFKDGFEGGSLKPEWTAQPSLDGIDGISAIHSTGELAGVAHTGSFGFALGKSADGDLTTNALDLTLDLSAHTNDELELSFWFKHRIDETHYEDGIFISDDNGLNFRKIFSFEPQKWRHDLYGSFPALDLDSLIRREGLTATSNFVIRFQQRGVSDFSGSFDYQADGIYIDDIEIKVADTIVPSTLPYANDFESGLGSEWKINNPFLVGGTAQEEHITPSWSVGTFEGQGMGTGFALGLGKSTSNNGENTSAIDLHLDLSAHVN
ncbi:MAG: hypothetical protein RIG77_17970, partial [Cyclobacteriaceae bacterium]